MTRHVVADIFDRARQCEPGVVDERIKLVKWFEFSDYCLNRAWLVEISNDDADPGEQIEQRLCLFPSARGGDHIPAGGAEQASGCQSNAAGRTGNQSSFGGHGFTVVSRARSLGTVRGMARVASSLPPQDALLPERHASAPAPGERLPMHYAYCIGCGDQVPNGLRMTHVAGEGLQITSQFTVTEGHQGAPGLAHGGLLTLAFDEALGALNYLLRSPAVTARLDMEFLRPVPVGSVLEIESEITGVSGRKIYKAAVGKITGATEPVLRAKALFIEVPTSHFTTYGSPEVLAKLAANPDVAYNSAAVQVNP